MYENQETVSYQDDAAVKAGVAAYMTKVFSWMFMGLMLTAATAILVTTSETLFELVYESGLVFAFIIAELVLVIVLSFLIRKMSPTVATVMFCVYSIVSGVTFSAIFIIYELSSITSIFFVTAGIFGAMALIGHTTKKDLSGIGYLCFIGLIGIIIVSIVNIFLASSGLDFIISAIAILVFVGFTAYDTQKIKEFYYSNSGNPTMLGRMAIVGALALYLDFINLFLRLLRMFGRRK